jgi:REP element-mobilizing transposase RayT
MPKFREAVYGKGHLHFISCTCYQNLPKLTEEKHRNVFVRIMEELRVKFRFAIVGYVVMPDHFRLLMREPEIDTAANAVQTLQARYRRRYNTPPDRTSRFGRAAARTRTSWEPRLLRPA